MMPKKKHPLRNSRKKEVKAILECGEVHISLPLASSDSLLDGIFRIFNLLICLDIDGSVAYITCFY